MLFYLIPTYKEVPNKSFTLPGFEETIVEIYKKKNTSNIYYLENVHDSIELIQKDQEGMEKFFILGINKFKRKLEAVQETNWQALTNDYKISISQYSYDKLSNRSKINVSTKERNKIWEKNVLKYLEENHYENKPILIVCGAYHLSGEIGETFLGQFINQASPHKVKLERMNVKGNWIEFSPQAQ